MKRLKITLVSALLLLFFGVNSFASNLYQSTTEEELARGISLISGKTLTEHGFVSYDAMVIDANDPTITFEIIRDKNEFRKTNSLTQLTASNPSVIGSINASFFSMGNSHADPLGLIVEDNKINYVRDYNNFSEDKYANFILSGGNYFFDYLSVSLSLQTDSGSLLRLSGINESVVSDLPVLYNNTGYKNTGEIRKLGDVALYLLEDGLLKGEVTTDIDIMDNQYIIAIKKDTLSQHTNFLLYDGNISLNAVREIDKNAIDLALSGGGLLLKDSSFVSEGLRIDPEDTHPRSAVGINKKDNKIIFLTIDGRGDSKGANLEEVAAIMYELGATDAMSFDGGGSTTLVKKDIFTNDYTVVNKTSGGGERKIVNGLGVVINREPTNDFTLKIKAAKKMMVGKTYSLYAGMKDSNGNIYDIESSNISYSSNKSATINGNEFTPAETGIYEITGSYNGISDTVYVDVMDQVVDLLETPILDELYAVEENLDAKKMLVFGATAKRNRILDNIVLNKVYEMLPEYEMSVFAGQTDVNEEKITIDSLISKNKFESMTKSGVTVINLASSSGSFVASDSSQLNDLEYAIKSSESKAIVVTSDVDIVDSIDNEYMNEMTIFHNTMSSLSREYDKTIFYIYAGGYDTTLKKYDNIRYINLNGLWYNSSENLDLQKTFRAFVLYVNGDEISYRINSIY